MPNRVYSETIDDLSPLVNSYSKLQVIGGNGAGRQKKGACIIDKYEVLNYIANNSNAKQWSAG